MMRRGRSPVRSMSDPARGETTKKAAVHGRSRSPTSSGSWPSAFLQVQKIDSMRWRIGAR